MYTYIHTYDVLYIYIYNICIHVYKKRIQTHAYYATIVPRAFGIQGQDLRHELAESRTLQQPGKDVLDALEAGAEALKGLPTARAYSRSQKVG